MRRILTIIIFILSVLSSGCSKWLDVKPEDRFIEDVVFKTPQGFTDALNGIYLDLGSSNMYGFQMTMGTMDILAQYYYISPSHSQTRQQMALYNYEDATAMGQIDQMWTKMFKSILTINNFLANLETKGDVLDQQSFSLFKGEALALRAYLYLDLLRMFTPNYTLNPKAEIIPYSDKAISQASPYRSSEYVAERIMADLKTAGELLQKHDPAINETVIDKTTGAVNVGSKPYLTYRNYRLNYYAVLALQARTYLWMGQKGEALALAEQIIAKKSKFPWITNVQVNSPKEANLVFSTEMLFGFENPQLYQIYDQHFSSKLASEATLFSGHSNSFLDKVYDSWELDFRYKPMWTPDGDKTYSIFFKYKDIVNLAFRNFRYTVPAIGLSEVFLIAAECEPDPNKGLAYLNELREHRNCLPLGNALSLDEDIMEEARREFYGVGQLWYFYKRHNYSSIYSATALSEVAIDPGDYVFPLPYSETEPR